MVKIRLSRFGKKHAPFYRIVVTNAKSKREGEALEYVGTFDPSKKEDRVIFNKPLVEEWLKKGAVPTATVNSMLIKAGLVAKPTIKKTFNSKPGKKKQERAAK